mgnify:CR=1 FL=1
MLLELLRLPLEILRMPVLMPLNSRHISTTRPDMIPPDMVIMHPARCQPPRRRKVPTNRSYPPIRKYPSRRRTPPNRRNPTIRGYPTNREHPRLIENNRRLRRRGQKLSCGRNSILPLLLLAKSLFPLVLFALPLVLGVVLPLQIVVQTLQISPLFRLRSFILLSENGGDRHGSGDNNSHKNQNQPSHFLTSGRGL